MAEYNRITWHAGSRCRAPSHHAADRNSVGVEIVSAGLRRYSATPVFDHFRRQLKHAEQRYRPLALRKIGKQRPFQSRVRELVYPKGAIQWISADCLNK